MTPVSDEVDAPSGTEGNWPKGSYRQGEAMSRRRCCDQDLYWMFFCDSTPKIL